MKVKVLDNVQKENVVTYLVTDRQTDQPTDWPTAWIARVAIRH